MSTDLHGTCPGCGLPWHLPPRPLATGRAWSDGYQDTLAPPALVTCPACGALAWVQDTLTHPAPLRTGTWWDRLRGRAPTPVTPSIPSEAALLDALAGGFARTPREERHLRLLAWWQRNHAQRALLFEDASPPAAGEAWQASLRALLSLLDARLTGDALLRAEALRHLGDFTAALATLP